jgi:class 3 adenylate cyclase
MHTIPGHETLCGFENPPGAQFCGSCGKPLRTTCGRCGTEVPAGFSFCTACGSPLAAAATRHVAEPGPDPAWDEASQASPVISSERRLVSVLFCDLVDFTGMAERLDPEEVRDILSRYFDAARGIVATHGGSIEKFIGDAVVAVWGSPIAREDDAERAVRAALEVVEAVAELRGTTIAKPLAARAAVATGESAVTVGLDGQGMVAGDIMNTAARLQSVSEPGSVLMNDATRRATATSIVARPAGKQQLKGKAAPVHTWHAIRPAATSGNGPAARDRPLVGRRRELKELTAVFEGAIHRGRSRLVSVVGIAGIGKTRLIRELGRRLLERSPNIAWHVGRAPRYGAGTAFAPLAEMVRRELRIAESDSSGIARQKLHASLPDLVSDDAERAWVEARLAVLLDPDDEGRFEREELFAAWRRLFELLAQRAPLVLVFEDAHRADPGLLDFAEYVVETARDRPIVVVTLARPELLEVRPGWGAGLRSFSSLHVEKLPNADMTRLLAGLRAGLPASLVSQALRRADGVPLYAVEMSRMLQDMRAPEGASPEGPSVPTSLHALIAARIDNLPPAERSLLMSAAVLGRRFSAAALAAVSDSEPGGVAAAVDRLRRQEILVMDSSAGPAVRGQLKFQEQLVQDVAYRTLARGERRRRHLRAAQYLEDLNDEELVELVADHLVKAYQADPSHAEASAIADRARPALIRAGRRARTLHAPDRALGHLEDALAMVVDDAERATISEEAAAAAQSAGGFEAAERYWRGAMELRTQLGDRVAAARATARLAGLLLVIHRNDAALAELEAALDGLGQVSPDEREVVELAGQLARAHLLRGDTAEAVSWAERAMAGAQRLDLPEAATDALITRGAARVRIGQEKAGLDDLNAAIAQCSANDLISLELRARNNLAWLLVADDPRLTVDAARKGFEIGRQRGVQDMALQLASVAFVTAIDTGDWDWAMGAIADVEAEPMSPAHRIDFAATATILRGLRGTRSADRPLTLQEPFPPDTDPQLLGQAAFARAWVAFLHGRYKRARELAQEAAGQAIGVNRHAALMLSVRAALWGGQATLLADDLATMNGEPLAGRAATAGVRGLEAASAAQAGDRAAADAGFGDALATWRELDLPFPLLLSLLERARFLPGNPDQAEATGLMERLGAKGLARLV